MSLVAERPEAATDGQAPALDLDRFLPYRLSVLANRVSRALAARYEARFGLTIPEWRVLAVLGRDGRLSVVGIAARTSMDKVKVSRAVGALERRGLVVRERDPDDRRVTWIEQTAAGRRVYAAVAALAVDWQERWLAELDEGERQHLWRLLDHLQARLRLMGELNAEAGGPD